MPRITKSVTIKIDLHEINMQKKSAASVVQAIAEAAKKINNLFNRRCH